MEGTVVEATVIEATLVEATAVSSFRGSYSDESLYGESYDSEVL